MAKRTLREESAGWNRSRAADLHHDSGGRGRRAERSRLSAGNSFERFDDRVLRGNSFRSSHHGAVFWAANCQRVCRRGGARSLLSAHTSRNLSACAGVSQCDAKCDQRFKRLGGLYPSETIFFCLGRLGTRLSPAWPLPYENFATALPDSS